mmetsp:Transcript_41616/g.67512  ORF Transcript_41616/g.67512 Transcript_41616/m.67512 type:complete len:218 (+) Transcript_41616:120-773(+)|eukprot:CAMPEP_0184646152 /NCGR_PEP_ID=MMETSP0308-20130426/2789_1 /TAXON_ID=38269 /ORGANISM="Gloeochaete witrockiana, Strain SAG 46.84" /LENGTH=217 /DNA_ID=CAMNT_0027075867 /DNA_START=93 /DNA_END=746 /DNA_ORIENTATION=-
MAGDKYVLTYFPARGRAEIARYLFAIGGIEYTDKRVEFPEFQKTLKPFTPFGQLPVLEVNGVLVSYTIPQSRAIERFIAKEIGLFGSNNLEAALIDSVVEHFVDVNLAYRKARETDDKNKDTEDKSKAKDEFFEKAFPAMLAPLEKFLTENGSGYLVGAKLSLADVVIYFLLTDYFDAKDKVAAILSHLPHLTKLVSTVGAIPALQAHLKSRPVTTM